MTTSWFGADAGWWMPFERDARRRYGDAVTIEVGAKSITYRHAGLDVPGRLDSVPVVIEFHATRGCATYCLPPQDYPLVWADRGAVSKHRHPGGNLCLYNPFDPPEQRWTSEQGLFSLFELTRDHLFFELQWRKTGGHPRGEWLGPEAPHGIPKRRVA